ncbi:hypothetical protein Thimo_0162 [Thioflavicoccus mobilis 8321]|uniref:Uncharacterized protein n=1 Tax=Thioflavicoccus mobilis 8321 TaxID=765912 RepID=L0GT99_9GAMM|nr:hypothetical protein [Thioflavicoccus mobilis]AGA89037.1 hypothetical protein Thimo_0162 [Thioflavicoccus mobilis 8321]
MRTGWGLGLIALSLLLMAIGAGLCLWALYLFLKVLIGPAGAALGTGLATLTAALLAAWAAARLTR